MGVSYQRTITLPGPADEIFRSLSLALSGIRGIRRVEIVAKHELVALWGVSFRSWGRECTAASGRTVDALSFTPIANPGFH
jgi:hypothetical protein